MCVLPVTGERGNSAANMCVPKWPSLDSMNFMLDSRPLCAARLFKFLEHIFNNIWTVV